MSIADLFVIGVVAVLFGFVLFANIHHQRRTLRQRKAEASRKPARPGHTSERRA